MRAYLRTRNFSRQQGVGFSPIACETMTSDGRYGSRARIDEAGGIRPKAATGRSSLPEEGNQGYQREPVSSLLNKCVLFRWCASPARSGKSV